MYILYIQGAKDQAISSNSPHFLPHALFRQERSVITKAAAIFALSGAFCVKVEYDIRFLSQDHESGAASTMILHLLCRRVTPAPVSRLFSLFASAKPQNREGNSPSDPPEEQRLWQRRHSCCRKIRGRA